MTDAQRLDPAAYPLSTRTGLPDALRVLLKDYPRDLWEADRGFDGLIRFWLDRHIMFRRLLAGLDDAARTGMDRKADPRQLASQMGRYGQMLVGELHMHHNIEDMHYFPVLAGHDARVAQGFDILDADHHALDAHLAAFTDTANDSLRALAGGADPVDPCARMQTAAGDLRRLLDRHLEDEEDLVVPVLLRYGTAGFG